MAEHKKRLFMPLFIVFILVFSIFGIVIGSFSSSNVSDKIEYEGYKFTFDGNRWFTFKDKQRIESIFDPRELDYVYTGDLLNKIFNHKKIYLSMSPKVNLDVERNAFRQILASLTGVSVVNSCTVDEEGCEDLPLKDCQDSIFGEILVIKLEEGDEDSIQEEASCVAIIGDSGHLIRIIEKIRLGAIL